MGISKVTKALMICGLVVLVFTVSFSASQQSKPQQWEYKFEYHCDEKKANAFASDGWELVNMGVSSFGSVAAVHCSFKRSKS